jgi:hypothetical protein
MDDDDDDDAKHKLIRRIGDRARRAAGRSVRAFLKFNDACPFTSSGKSEKGSGALGNPPQTASGPVQFAARYRGKDGCAYITTTATTPAISWVAKHQGLDHAWTITIDSLRELKKVDSMGWKSKLLLSWALDEKPAGGLALKTESNGEFQLSEVDMRNELFNRLVAIGCQIWEVW